MARPLKGDGLKWDEKRGWLTRAMVTIDGVRVRKVVELGTRDRVVARRKRKELVSGKRTPESVSKAETFAEAAERVHKLRVAAGVKSAKDEHGRVKRFAVPLLGELAVTTIDTPQINGVLDAVRDAGKSKQTVQHVRQGLRAIFAELKREGAVKANPVDDAKLPRMPAEKRKERTILDDAELAAYLAWESPSKAGRYGVLERQTLAAVSRMFGGQRAGDLHALEWPHLDLEDFAYGAIPREKTATPQMLTIPEMLRPILRAWWERQGCPTEGLVFPAARGKRAGERKTKVSHARALKRDLRRVLGIEVWDADREQWIEERKPESYTKRERELFTETDYSLPVDFHSFRRAFNTALADAGVNIQVAMRLSGHSNPKTHMRYVMSRVRTIPDAALPNLGESQGVWQLPAKLDDDDSETFKDLSGVDGTRTRGLRRDRPAL